MKGIIKKLITSVLAIGLALVATLSNVEAVNTTAGKTVYVNITYSNVKGVDGELSYQSGGIIESAVIDSSSSFSGGTFRVGNSGKNFVAYSTNPGTVTVRVKVVVSASAQPGDSQNFSIYGDITNADDSETIGATRSGNVTIVAEGQGGSSKPETKVDYTELKKQIGIAEGLKKAEYTSDSWSVLATALSNGKTLLSSKSQKAVDDGAKALADAIAQLVKMDYSRLQEALNQSRDVIDGDKAGLLWEKLVNARTEGNALLGSTDQAAVNAAADKLFDLVEEIKAYLEEQLGLTVVGDGEEFCNIPLHQFWPILFFISLVGNIVLVYMLVQSKKKNFNDTTPVVDYNIADDDK